MKSNYVEIGKLLLREIIYPNEDSEMFLLSRCLELVLKDSNYNVFPQSHDGYHITQIQISSLNDINHGLLINYQSISDLHFNVKYKFKQFNLFEGFQKTLNFL